MVSAAINVKAFTLVTQASTASSRGTCLQQESQTTLNPLAYAILMANILMVRQSCPGVVVGYLCGMLHAQTLWPLRTLHWLPESLDWWQSRQNNRRRPSMRTCRPHTISSPLALIPPACLVLKLALSFFKELGCRLRARSGEPLSFCHLLQQIGVTIERGNSAAVLGTAPGPWPGVEI